MAIKSVCVCDYCDTVILKDTDGFLIKGNISASNPDIILGLIGNNFPTPSEDGTILLSEIKSTVLCKKCLIKALNLVIVGERYLE